MLYLCVHCHEKLSADQFAPSAFRKRDMRCLSCSRAKNKAQRALNPERTRKMARDRMRKHRLTAIHKSRPCTAADRARAAKYSRENKPKKRAHNIVQRAINLGRLQRQPCEVCLAVKSQAHHDDYSKPLQVRWLCATHHNREHKWIA